MCWVAHFKTACQAVCCSSGRGGAEQRDERSWLPPTTPTQAELPTSGAHWGFCRVSQKDLLFSFHFFCLSAFFLYIFCFSSSLPSYPRVLLGQFLLFPVESKAHIVLPQERLAWVLLPPASQPGSAHWFILSSGDCVLRGFWSYVAGVSRVNLPLTCPCAGWFFLYCQRVFATLWWLSLMVRWHA